MVRTISINMQGIQSHLVLRRAGDQLLAAVHQSPKNGLGNSPDLPNLPTWCCGRPALSCLQEYAAKQDTLRNRQSHNSDLVLWQAGAQLLARVHQPAERHAGPEMHALVVHLHSMGQEHA